MAIPRRLIVLAVSAAAAGAMLYVSQKMKKQMEEQQRREKSPVDEANEAKEKLAEDEKKKAEESSSSSSSTSEPSSSSSTASSSSSSSSGSTSQKELALFLAGDAWHDEIGWQALWEKEGVTAPEEWLKTKGKEVLVAERKKLTDHPALLAGCRRRWIVVCRYAGIDVGDAASLWTSTEVA